MENQYCGPQALFMKPPRITFFEASCKKHDEGYEEGGNELRRTVCDLFFLSHMLNDINKYQKGLSRKLFYSMWAISYFLFVRIFGWLFFTYK